MVFQGFCPASTNFLDVIFFFDGMVSWELLWWLFAFMILVFYGFTVVQCLCHFFNGMVSWELLWLLDDFMILSPIVIVSVFWVFLLAPNAHVTHFTNCERLPENDGPTVLVFKTPYNLIV